MPNGGPASATITVKSNDPDAPEQTFRVAANGAVLDPQEPGSKSGEYQEPPSLDAPSDSGGCSASPTGARGTSALAALGLGLGLALVLRRRKA
jgi:MYXO-CTERM domain-containing protein